MTRSVIMKRTPRQYRDFIYTVQSYSGVSGHQKNKLVGIGEPRGISVELGHLLVLECGDGRFSGVRDVALRPPSAKASCIKPRIAH